MTRGALIAACGLALLVPRASQAQPPETLAAFDRYVRLTDARVSGEVGTGPAFLWLDMLGDARRRDVRNTLQRGEVVTDRLETRDGRAEIDVPGGLIHHWVGTVFIPGVPVARAVALLQDYDRHGTIYAPVITDAHLLSHAGDDFTFTMRFVIRKVISVTLATTQQARFGHPAPDRFFSRIITTRIAEVAGAGTPAEREKPPAENRGYLWRLVSYWRFLERDGGTYVQCESVSLTKPVPTGFGWLLGRAVSGVPRDITVANLAATRRTLVKDR